MPLEPIASRLADERSARIFAFFSGHHKTAPTAAARLPMHSQGLCNAVTHALIRNTDLAI
jgi:hypothetical protein